MGYVRATIRTLATALVAILCLSGSATAFTDSEIDEIFKVFDAQGDGKVTRTEFATNKIRIIYRDVKTDPMAGVTFEQTRISRSFFDSLDGDRNGRLSPLEISDGLSFDNVTPGNAETFTNEDFRRFMKSISR